MENSRFNYIPPALYDGWYETQQGNWVGREEFGLVLDSLGTPDGGSILDIGCGTGWFTRRLAAATKAQVTGIDVNREWLDYARSRDPYSLYLVADAMSLPFEDNSFSQVCSITALCFTPDWKKALAEAVRVAQKRVVIGLLNRNSLLWLEKGRKKGTAYDGAEWITPDELSEVAKGLPLADIHIETGIFLPSGSLLAQLAEEIMGHQFPWGSFLLMSATVIS